VLTSLSDHNHKQLHQLDYKFCVLYKGNFWYVTRALPQIKAVMTSFLGDEEVPSKDKDRIREKLDLILLKEQEECFQAISEVVDSFFAMVHKLILQARLSLSSSETAAQ